MNTNKKQMPLGDYLFMELANAVAVQIVQEHPLTSRQENLVLTGRIMGAMCRFFEEDLPEGLDANAAVQLIYATLRNKSSAKTKKILEAK